MTISDQKSLLSEQKREHSS